MGNNRILVIGWAAFFALALLIGCSPKLPERVNVPTLDYQVKSTVVSNEAYVFVDEFIDARANKAIVEYKDKEIPHIQDLGPIVVKGIGDALKAQGFSITDTAPIILSGQIRTWNAVVTSGMPSKVDASAELYVELLDPANKRMYSGTYKGYAGVQAGSLDEDEVKAALQASMKETINQIVGDQQLIKLLKSF